MLKTKALWLEMETSIQTLCKFCVFCAQSSKSFKAQRPHHDRSDEFDYDDDIQILYENQVVQVVYFMALYLRLIIDLYTLYKTGS